MSEIKFIVFEESDIRFMVGLGNRFLIMKVQKKKKKKIKRKVDNKITVGSGNIKLDLLNVLYIFQDIKTIFRFFKWNRYAAFFFFFFK